VARLLCLSGRRVSGLIEHLRLVLLKLLLVMMRQGLRHVAIHLRNDHFGHGIHVYASRQIR
jgi:hypothetical protein